MRANELTQKFRVKGEICLKAKPDKRWRILDAYDDACYIKEVGGLDFNIVDYDVLDKDWMPYKRTSKKVIPTTVKDKFGNDLHVGDEVYYACGSRGFSRSHEIEKGVIDGFTEKMVSVSGFLTSADKIGKACIAK